LLAGHPDRILGTDVFGIQADWLVFSNLSGMEIMPYVELLSS
jgi:hypothetical protein